MLFSKLNKGDMIRLGHYPQGMNGEVLPIKWQVLKVLPGRALVLADQVLDWHEFHTEGGPMRWEHSSIRDWLVNEFFTAAFTAEDQEQVFCNEQIEDPSGDFLWSLLGMETTTDSISDPIFLLCASDINELFPGEDALFCPGAEGQMTLWAEAKNPEADSMDGNVCWWLRSSNANMPMAYIVSPVASVGMSMIGSGNEQGVRPAMWVKIED